MRSALVPILESSFFVWRSIFGAACELQAVSWGGRVTILGFGIFILFLVTVYQAALTTQMVNANVISSVRNIDEGIALGKRFCGQRVTALQAAVLYPTALFTSDPSDDGIGLISRSDVFAQMDSGLCDLGVVYEQDLEREHSLGAHCDKMLIGKPILTSAEGIPVAPSKARALSYWLQEAMNDGSWATIKQRNKPINTCVANSPEAETIGQVTPSDFLAGTVLVWSITLLGVVLTAALGRRDRAVEHVEVAGSSNAGHDHAEVERSVVKLRMAAQEAVSDDLLDRGWDSHNASHASIAAVSSSSRWLKKTRESRASRASGLVAPDPDPDVVQPLD